MAQKIIFELDPFWVLEHQHDDVLPIENLCSFLKEEFEDDLSFEDVSFTSVTLIPQSLGFSVDSAKKLIAEFFNKTYGEEEFSTIATFSVEGKDDFSELEESNHEEDDSEDEIENDPDVDAFKKMLSRLRNDDEDDDDDEESPLFSETDDDDKNDDEPQQKSALDDINALVGAYEFKDLCQEIVAIAPDIIKHSNQSVFIAQSYLFSINKGYGLSTALELLSNLLVETKLIKRQYNRPVPIHETTYKDALDLLDRRYNSQQVQIVAINLSEAMNAFALPEFKTFLLKLSQYSPACIFVFTLPFVEKEVLKKAKVALNDLVFIKDVSFSPLNKKEIEAFAVKEIEKRGFTISPKGLEAFNQRIREEKSDGRFYGLNTIKKVVNELIYKKHLANSKANKPNAVISKKDALQICNVVSIDERTGEELLAKLVASDKLKEKIDEIVAQIMLSQQDGSLEKPCIHMQFIGNPGTGKTTVARIIGKLLREKGVLRIGDFHECAGRDLCGRFIGETAPKTASTCRDAYGSVLFIDEAYSLYRTEDAGGDYGREALDTLIAEMENHRTDLVVILAGYKDEMSLLMQGNPGLQSRIPYKIEFPNFTKEQLFEIFARMVKDNFKYSDDLFVVAKEYFDSLSEEFLTSKDFSNARFVRNLFERTWAKASMRCQLDGQKSVTLTKADFSLAIMDGEFNKTETVGKRRKIGFN